ncbi:hypothetical protein QE392_003229 [Microbacterium proteolyticum]|uniref:hypothetical protein n=1 Tax=Microbacterium proteolyticum TaxID=1572644 RepID=UPI00278462F0|nr:hypothetical protein [Microbacterium proteolyticum]MDQ1171425.1 hypothetical protein [Microbacterium proteolyticum]
MTMRPSTAITPKSTPSHSTDITSRATMPASTPSTTTAASSVSALYPIRRQKTGFTRVHTVFSDGFSATTA